MNELREGTDYTDREWFQVCAAMDSIGDTALVLDSNVWRSRSRAFPNRYFRLYGLLQAIHAQQDSIQFLWKSVAKRKRSVLRTSAWTRLRILRNELIAHSAVNAAAVSRISLRGPSPTVLRWPPEGTREIITVPLDALLDRYVEEAAIELDALADQLTSLLEEDGAPEA